jgi:glycosyltransferase involved in cell wall biosynthesis
VSQVSRLAVIFDAAEERWPSMDLVAEMLLRHLQGEHADRYLVAPVHPRFSGVFKSLPVLDERTAWNADRLLTRFVIYPAQLLARRREFDLFHVSDHTYSQLVHVLPGDRTGVFCHDLDAFACLIRPNGAVPAWRKAIARSQLTGLQRASLVFYSTEQVREEIERAGLVEPQRLVHAPYGVADEFFSADGVNEIPAGLLPSTPFLLHVGSSMPRKRLDVLFEVFAAVRRHHPNLVLVQQGAELTPEQRTLVERLGVSGAIIQPPRLSRAALAALYRRAKLVLLTSEREGFGLPLLEALAAGATVVASDIPAFREIAGTAASLCRVGDLEHWTQTVRRLIEDPASRPSLATRIATARRFTWAAHATTIAEAYARLSNRGAARA